MEILLLLLVGGWLAYKIRGYLVNSNLEGVRAHVFLDALRRGYSPQEANSIVHHRLMQAPAESAQLAYDAIRNFHGGRHLNMVGYAYRRGMPSMMPRWYQRFISDIPMTPSLKSIYEARVDMQGDDVEDVFSPASESGLETSTIPKFTERERKIADEAVEWCKNQIGAFLGADPQPLPDYGLHHDILVASYVCGFIQGQNVVHHTLKEWGSGDEGLEMVGFVILATPAIMHVLGADRAMQAMNYLPQLGPAATTDDIQLLDEMGGSDGMDHANGEPKQNGGMLRHYLVHNVPAGL